MAYIKKEVSEIVLLGLQRALDEELSIKKRGDKFRVTSHTHKNTYTVKTLNDMVVSCTCPHHEYHNVACKHMFAVIVKSKGNYKIQF